MERRAFISGLTGTLLAAPLAAEAQTAAKVYRVGWLAVPAADSPIVYSAFVQSLRDHGFIEGSKLIIDRRSAAGNVDRLPALGAELVRLKVDVIFATALAVPAARSATKTLPIVFATIEDPVAAGYVAGLARPGGNLTGLSTVNVELDAKRVTLLKEVIPGLTRLDVLLYPADPSAAAMRASTEHAARSAGVHLQVVEVKALTHLDEALAGGGAKRWRSSRRRTSTPPWRTWGRRRGSPPSPRGDSSWRRAGS
jgi:putative ABC transport system substrate-binding protein